MTDSTIHPDAIDETRGATAPAEPVHESHVPAPVPPTDPFWGDEPSIDALGDPPTPTSPSALEQLGPSPFPKNKFPFLGFLASVYDHVAMCANGEVPRDPM